MRGQSWAGAARALWRSAARTRLPRGGWLPASIALTASVGLALLAARGATDPGEALVVLDAAPSPRPVPQY